MNDYTKKDFKNDELKKLVIANKKNKKVSRISGLIGIIAVTAGLSASIYSIYESSNSKNDVLNNKIELHVNDSIKNELDIMEKINIKKDSIKDVVSLFIQSFNKPEIINQLLTDTVQKYYLKNNLSHKEIEWHQSWHKKHFPRAKVVLDKNEIVISFNKKDTTEVYANAIYYPDSLKSSIDIVYQIKLNNNMKIFYVRNLEPKE